MKASSRHPRILYTAFLLVMAFCPLGADTATPKVPSKSIKTVDLKKPGLVNAPIRDRAIVANTRPANLPALFKFSSGGAVISTDPYYTMELHTIRLGDVAICTNPFELYSEYGVRIKARSEALQTFVVQLVGASGGYLPTAEAIRGGHYSTEVYSNQVGPEGGNTLVDKTVTEINAMWSDTPDR